MDGQLCRCALEGTVQKGSFFFAHFVAVLLPLRLTLCVPGHVDVFASTYCRRVDLRVLTRYRAISAARRLSSSKESWRLCRRSRSGSTWQQWHSTKCKTATLELCGANNILFFEYSTGTHTTEIITSIQGVFTSELKSYIARGLNIDTPFPDSLPRRIQTPAPNLHPDVTNSRIF